MPLSAFLLEETKSSFVTNLIDSGTDSDSDSTSSSSSASSDTSKSSTSSSSDEDAVRGAELEALKRKQRTEKARAQSLVNRALRKQQATDPIMPVHPADAFKEDLPPTSKLTKPGITTGFRRQRLRLLWSWFSAFTGSIFSFLFSPEMKMKIRHSLNIVIVNDTNMTLRPSSKEFGRTKRSRVVSCMNNLQTLLFNVSLDNGSEAVEQGNLMDSTRRSDYRSFLMGFSLARFHWAEISTIQQCGTSIQFIAAHSNSMLGHMLGLFEDEHGSFEGFKMHHVCKVEVYGA